MSDKNQAIIDYLIQCPQILNSPLYFNLIDAKNDNIQIITTSEDRATNRPFVDGSVSKRYTFTLIIFKSISDLAVVKDMSYPNENVDDLAQAQELIDWIEEQNDLQNFPDFGEDCHIDDIHTTTDTPQYDGIDDEVAPPLAMYSIAIVINYIDTSKVLWTKGE